MPNDKRIRFQKPSFRHRLEAQRNYKRRTRSLPEGAWNSFLFKLGIGTTASKIAVVGVFVFLIYLSFIPNLFFIKNTRVEGAGTQQIDSVAETAKSYLSKKNPWPQRNLLLLSKAKLSSFLLENNQNILKIESITKDFPNTLQIKIIPRTDTFIISAPNGTFLAGSDGLIREQIDQANNSQQPQQGLINVKISPQDPVFAGRQAFSAELGEMLKTFFQGLEGAAKTNAEFFEITESPGTDVIAKTKSGFLIKLSQNTNAKETLEKLKLIYYQLGDSEAKNLFYIDLRIDDKAYVCYKNTACILDQRPAPEATSSPETLNP